MLIKCSYNHWYDVVNAFVTHCDDHCWVVMWHPCHPMSPFVSNNSIAMCMSQRLKWYTLSLGHGWSFGRKKKKNGIPWFFNGSPQHTMRWHPHYTPNQTTPNSKNQTWTRFNFWNQFQNQNLLRIRTRTRFPVTFMCRRFNLI